jgi:hypothetical protein
MVVSHRAGSFSDDQPGAAAPTKTAPSEIVSNNNRFQFSLKEGLIVVKEAVDILCGVKCLDKVTVLDALATVSDLERRLQLLALPGEEIEVRYQLHYLCVSLIHTVLSRAPQLLLLKNTRRLFVEINTSMLALLGVVLNCSLVFWQPDSTRGNLVRSKESAGGVAPERVEFICAHLIELVLTQGDIDHSRPLSDAHSSRGGATPKMGASSKHRAGKTSNKNFRAYRPADTPMGPAGFISLLRIQTGELLRKVNEKGQRAKSVAIGMAPDSTTAGSADASTNEARHNAAAEDTSSSTAAVAGSADVTAAPVTNVYRKGLAINYHELFQVFNRIVDDDVPVESAVGQVGMFTIKHRHAVFALQLFLYLALGNTPVNLSDAILMLHKGISQFQTDPTSGYSSSAVDSVIPCDVDILLQSMHPGMVPALLSLELFRRVLEEEFRRVAFLRKIAASHPEVSDLQYLNVQFPGQFDLGLKTGRSSATDSVNHSSKVEVPGHDALALPPPEMNGMVVSHIDSHTVPPALHVSRFKSTKDAHVQWVEDLQSHLQRLTEQISNLISPANVTSGGMKAPSFLGNAATAKGPAAANDSAVSVTPTIPLPASLVYRLLAHLNTLRSITATRSVHGLARVRALEPQFMSIMKDLLAARQRILSIVTAMTWPMRKKLDWLRMKYNTILEENGTAAKQAEEFHTLLDRYEGDIAAYKASLTAVDREKHTIEYRKTRTLHISLHEPQIQALIVEHCTEEYAQKLAEIKAKEARLDATIAQFSDEFNHLSAQGETLKAAQRSLNVIDQAQAGTRSFGCCHGAPSCGVDVSVLKCVRGDVR